MVIENVIWIPIKIQIFSALKDTIFVLLYNIVVFLKFGDKALQIIIIKSFLSAVI